jgi:hypothetical protein
MILRRCGWTLLLCFGCNAIGAKAPSTAPQPGNTTPPPPQQLAALGDIPHSFREVAKNLHYMGMKPRFIWYKTVQPPNPNAPLTLAPMACKDAPDWWWNPFRLQKDEDNFDNDFASVCRSKNGTPSLTPSFPSQNRNPLRLGDGIVIAIYDSGDIVDQLEPKPDYIGLTIQATTVPALVPDPVRQTPTPTTAPKAAGAQTGEQKKPVYYYYLTWNGNPVQGDTALAVTIALLTPPRGQNSGGQNPPGVVAPGNVPKPKEEQETREPAFGRPSTATSNVLARPVSGIVASDRSYKADSRAESPLALVAAASLATPRSASMVPVAMIVPASSAQEPVAPAAEQAPAPQPAPAAPAPAPVPAAAPAPPVPVDAGGSASSDQSQSLLAGAAIPQTHNVSHYNIVAGLVGSTLRSPSWTRQGSAPAVTCPTGTPQPCIPSSALYETVQNPSSHYNVDPVLFFMIYVHPLDAERKWRPMDLIPAISFGLSLSSPSTDYFAGPSFEVRRGVQFVIGRHIGKVNELAPTIINDPTSSAAPATIQRFHPGWFAGATFNFNFIQTLFKSGG